MERKMRRLVITDFGLKLQRMRKEYVKKNPYVNCLICYYYYYYYYYYILNGYVRIFI
jgi:hypothetical protein